MPVVIPSKTPVRFFISRARFRDIVITRQMRARTPLVLVAAITTYSFSESRWIKHARQYLGG
jgi:hypothetical protein